MDKIKSVDVCLTPELMHLYEVREKTVVVVDILRATSCMVTAFAHGAKSIMPVADLDECRGMKEKSFITSGERNGEKVNGFDKGNSPFEYMTPDIKGKKSPSPPRMARRQLKKVNSQKNY